MALAAVAVATERLLLGTGVCLLVQRDPIITAKAVASLDHVSVGRFLFGVGGGWNREEMENHGTDPRRRWRLLRERVLAMKEIWTRDEAEYHGEYVDFDPLWSWPKPVQRPHPPILLGGNGPDALGRVVEYGDGWMPIVGRPGPPIEDRAAELRRLAAKVGRDRISVSIFAAPRDPRALERYRGLDVDRCVFLLPSAGSDAVLPILAECAELARQFA